MPGLFDFSNGGGGLLGNLGAGAQNFLHGASPLGAVGDLISGVTTGQRTDPVGMYQQMTGLTYKALLDAGVPEPQARLGATNPDVQKAITAKMFPKYVPHNVGNTAGAFNEATGGYSPQYIAPEFKTVAAGDTGISYQPPLVGGAPGGVPRPGPVQGGPLPPPPGAPGPTPLGQGAPGTPPIGRQPPAPVGQGGTQTIVPGMSLQEKTAQTEQGKVQGQTAASLLPLQAQTQQAIQLADKMIDHPGQKLALGIASNAPVFPGSQQANFLALLKQAQSGIFRQAAHDLHGLGSLSNTEGSKLESANARLERSQSPQEFNQALREYKYYMQKGFQNAQLIAAGKMKPFEVDPNLIPPPGATIAAPTGAPAPAPTRAPNAAAIKALRADPARRDEFDAYYGSGAANKVLGGG